MPKAAFVHEGDAIDHTGVADIAAGDVVVEGDLVGVARLDRKAGTPGSLAVKGVFDFPKATGASTAIAKGVLNYWDEAEQVAKTDSESGANKLIGKSVAAAGDNDTHVRIRLSQ